MSSKERNQLKQQFKADMRQLRKWLIKSVCLGVWHLLNGIHLIFIDLIFGKARYRRRGRTATPRKIIHETIIRQQKAPRVVYLRERQ